MASIIKVLTENTGSIQSLQQLLDQARAYPAKCLTLLCADKNGYTPETLDPLLKALDVPVFGGIFPQLISGTGHLDRGNLLLLWDQPIDYAITPSIGNKETPLNPQLPQNSCHANGEGFLMLFIDGLSQNIELFLDKLYLETGDHCEVAGGGAGSLSLQQAPCILTQEGLVEDCALLAWIPGAVGIGIRHGWKAIAGPFVATTSERNEVHALNYQPAFDVYSQTLEEARGTHFGDNFFDVAKTYPLGIHRLDSQVTVRDPILRNEDSLICVGNVPNFSKIYILEGEQTSLIEAAGEATSLSLKELGSRSDFSFIFNCISRALFLEDSFGEELQEIADTLPEETGHAGLLTLGEIATSELGSLQLHNKSVVVASMGGPA